MILHFYLSFCFLNFNICFSFKGVKKIMLFRIKLSLLIFSLMFGVGVLEGDETLWIWEVETSYGDTIYLSPGSSINLSYRAKPVIDTIVPSVPSKLYELSFGKGWDELQPPNGFWLVQDPPIEFCDCDCERSCSDGWKDSWGGNKTQATVSGGYTMPPNFAPSQSQKLQAGRCACLFSEAYYIQPGWNMTAKADQVPDQCSEAGDPVNVMDGTFNIESIDISSGKSNGVGLVRTYRSRERSIHINSYPEYKRLILPFSDGGWIHNYVKSIIIKDEVPGSSYDFYDIRDGNNIRNVRYKKANWSDTFQFADNYKVHNGFEEIDDNHWEYIKPDGTIEFYSRSDINEKIALVDSVEQFGETTLRFGYDEGDTLKYVEDKWGDSLKFYYKSYEDTIWITVDQFVIYYLPLLDKVEISGKDESIEYKYKRYKSLFGKSLKTSFYRLSQIVKHTSEDSLIVLDRYYYNRNLVFPADTGMDCKTDIATQIFPQGAYDENNDTSMAAYDSLRLTGYRVNNWYGKFPNEGVYYQEIASGDTILEKIYIERFYSGSHRVDSIYVYHWEDLRELGAHDPNSTSFTPDTSGYDYKEVIKYNPVGTRASVSVAGKTTTYLSYDDDYNPLLIEQPDGDTIRYEYYQYTANGETRYSSYPTKIKYNNEDSVLNYYSRPDTINNPYYIRLDESVDEMGRTTVYTYDGNNYTDEIILDDRYVAGEGVSDVVTDYDYNAIGNLLQVEDPEGVVTYYEYSDNNNGPFLLKSGVDIGGDSDESNDIITYYSYNGIGEIETKVEARENPSVMDTTEYEYDVMGRLSKTSYPNGTYEEFVYDKAGNLLQKKSLDTLGNSVITHEYKSYPSGKLLEVEENESSGYTTEYDYNQDGKLISFTSANGKTINYNYNEGKLVSTHYPDTTKDSLGYYPCGCYLQFKEDRNGEVTEYLYDERDRMRKKLYYDDISDYNSSSPSDSLVYEYNKAGEIAKTTDKNGDILYSWDDVGNLDTVKVYSLYENVYQYDLSGRKTYFKSYKYGTPGQVYLEQTFQYDDAGRGTSTTADGNTWNLSYYDNNALKEILYPEFYITAASEKVRETEAFTIGKMGEISEISTVLKHNVTDLIDNPGFESGNLTGWDCYPQAGATSWYIDTTDSIVEISCGSTHGTGSPAYSWEVTDSISKEGDYCLHSPYSPTEPYSDIEYALQHFDLSDYSRPFEASCWVKTNGLNDGVWVGVILWVDYTDSIRIVAHGYSDEITGTNDWEKVVISIDEEFDVNDLEGVFYIERMRDSGEVWVDDVVLQKGDTLQTAKIAYEYDNRTNRKQTYIKLPDGTEEEYIYRYDNLTRLISTKFRSSEDSLKYKYTYDAVGNRTKKEGICYGFSQDYNYNYNYNTNNNRLTSITELGESYTYNDRGDLLTATGGYTFNYDKEGRLEEIIEASGADTNKFSFSYTSEGRRFRKIFSTDTSGAVEADTTYYVYDGMFAVAELDGHLDLKAKYIYTNGMLVGKIDSDDELFQYFHDGLGSVTMISDTTGSYQNLYTYDDFGNFRSTEESVPNSYYYTGQERDEAPSGLYNLRARYYAPGIGRFTQEDPIMHDIVKRKLLPFWEYSLIYGDCSSSDNWRSESNNKPIAPQDNNPYVYCNNNSINMIDPSGLWGIPGTNWCGGNYSGGRRKRLYCMSEKERKSLLPPVNRLDFCCMRHDYCYLRCNEAEYFNFEDPCQKKCNRLFAICIYITSVILPITPTAPFVYP